MIMLERRHLELSKLCAREISRFAINGVLVDPQKKAIVATSGRIMVAIQVDMDVAGEPWIIPAAAFEAALVAMGDSRRACALERDRIHISHLGIAIQYVSIEGSFTPNWFDLIPKRDPEKQSFKLSVLGLGGIPGLSTCQFIQFGRGMLPARVWDDDGGSGAVMPTDQAD